MKLNVVGLCMDVVEGYTTKTYFVVGIVLWWCFSGLYTTDTLSAIQNIWLYGQSWLNTLLICAYRDHPILPPARATPPPYVRIHGVTHRWGKWVGNHKNNCYEAIYKYTH